VCTACTLQDDGQGKNWFGIAKMCSKLKKKSFFFNLFAQYVITFPFQINSEQKIELT